MGGVHQQVLGSDWLLVVHSGDFLSPSLLGRIDNGEAMVELLNRAFIVRNVEASIAWYQNVFQASLVDGMHRVREPALESLAPGWPSVCITTRAIRVRSSTRSVPVMATSPYRWMGARDLQAWADWLDSLEIAHSGIQSKKEPFAYSTIVFRDIDNIQLEVVAIDV